MSQENCDYIIKLKKEKETKGKKANFRSQYGTSEMHKQNTVATSQEKEEPPTKTEQIDDISKYQIWKPAIYVRKQNLLRFTRGIQDHVHEPAEFEDVRLLIWAGHGQVADEM